jgi:hypothetical protein
MHPVLHTVSVMGPNYLLALGALCTDPVSELSPLVVEEGKLAAELGVAHWSATAGQLRASPDRDHGIMSLFLLNQNVMRHEFATAWPFARSGVQHLLTIDMIEPQPETLFLNIVSGVIVGSPIALFDSQCAAALGIIEEGQTVLVRVMGWAIRLQTDLLAPFRRLQAVSLPPIGEDISFEARNIRQPQSDLSLSLRIDPAFGPPVYEVEGLAVAVRDGPALFGRRIHVLDVAVANAPAPSALLVIEIWVPAHRWTGPPPVAGDRVSGMVWLQGLFEPQEPCEP